VTLELQAEHAAGAAFDGIAADYDTLFTFSAIGRTQRNVVWKRAAAAFAPGDRVLELNCGTGEDALFLAGRGLDVTACDASGQMIEQAKVRKKRQAPEAAVDFHVLPTERLYELPAQPLFDGVFSNFSGLNCVADLGAVASELAIRLRPQAKLLLCLSTRFCLWEILHYAAKGDFRRALRRCSGRSPVSLSACSFTAYYPTLRQLRTSFEPSFRLRSVTGVGIAVPPSYLEKWIGEHSRLLTAMKYFDAVACDLPGFRVIGDHMLLSMEKV
jgi:ubiquinone/menaquinone biosynthesis C-methylase UbiE